MTSSRTRRTVSRALALTAMPGLVLATSLATAPAAHAAWSTQHTFHGAKVQVCKTANGQRLKVRVDNRRGNHPHTGSVNVGEAYVQVRAAAGRISGTKAIAFAPGDDLSWGGGEAAGIHFGDMIVLRKVSRC